MGFAIASFPLRFLDCRSIVGEFWRRVWLQIALPMPNSLRSHNSLYLRRVWLLLALPSQDYLELAVGSTGGDNDGGLRVDTFILKYWQQYYFMNL